MSYLLLHFKGYIEIHSMDGASFIYFPIFGGFGSGEVRFSFSFFFCYDKQYFKITLIIKSIIISFE